MRLLMNTIGNKPGRVRYFAVYAVAVSLAAGLIPMLWGMVLDVLRARHFTLLGLTVDRYGVLFGVTCLSLFVVAVLLACVHEPKSKPATFMIYEVFVGFPARSLVQFIQRFRY